MYCMSMERREGATSNYGLYNSRMVIFFEANVNLVVHTYAFQLDT